MVKILCIIPARSGSKGIPDKNIMNFNGKPMLTWSIYHALNNKYSKNIKTIVSTDSQKYADIAIKYGAEAPFLRPNEISGDNSTDFECFLHCTEWLKNNQNYQPDIILHLRPTQPCRNISDINKSLDIFIENKSKYDSLRSVIPVEKSPFKMYTIYDNTLNPLFKNINNISEPFNQARQLLPKTYLHNGYIDIFNYSLLEKKTISGEKIYPYIMHESNNVDIDSYDDLTNSLQKPS